MANFYLIRKLCSQFINNSYIYYTLLVEILISSELFLWDVAEKIITLQSILLIFMLLSSKTHWGMVATYLLKCEVIIVVLLVSHTCADAAVPMNKVW